MYRQCLLPIGRELYSFSGTAKFILFFILLSVNLSYGQSKPVIKRICVSNSDHSITIYWQIDGDTCNQLTGINIFGYDKNTSALIHLDSINTPNTYSWSSKAGVFDKFLDSFFIEYVINCGGIKKIRSKGIIVDIAPPAPINPDSVSVKGNKVYIGWKPQIALDTKGYVIYDGNNVTIATVFGEFSDFYVDSLAGNPNSKFVTYKMAVLDSCDNISPLGSNHGTIFLSVSEDSCKKLINLNWNAYLGWAADSYQVLYSIDGGLHFFRGGVSKGISFAFKGILNQNNYQFYVRGFKAGNPGITSSSNVKNITTTFSNIGNEIYLSLVTTSDKGIRLEWEVPSVRNISSFLIERGKDTIVFNSIANLSSNGGKYYFLTDTSADISKVHYYRITAINYCGVKLGVGNVCRNIALSVSRNSSGRYLNWDEYRRWHHKVSNYMVYRSNDKTDSASWQNIATLKGDTGNFTDLDSVDEINNFGICYKVLALGRDSSLGVPALSYSNEFCVLGPPVIRMPNAIMRGGYNTYFKPVMLYTDLGFCSMKIYNRWGEKIFETSDISVGWDAKLNGEYVPEGVYIFILEVIGLDKTIKVVRGTFSVL